LQLKNELKSKIMANQPIVYQRPPVPIERRAMYLLGAAVAVGCIWAVFENKFGNQPLTTTIDQIESGVKNTTQKLLPKVYSDAFPLKQGSRGTRVTQLQQAVAKLIGQDAWSKLNGATAIAKNGGYDGIFGPATEGSVRQAGYSVPVDEATFNRIVGNTTAPLTSTGGLNALQVANDLYKQAHQVKLDEVISTLQQIRNTTDYVAVNEQYKAVSKTLSTTFPAVSKTIVNDLLSVFGQPADHERLKNEFLRIGLKLDPSGTKWSLSGLPVQGTIITLVQTFVKDAAGKTVTVNKNVILGTPLQTSNGFTWFKSIDNTVAAVPSSDIRFL
jgi:peptidoglycan hydrolase-like protein with peptidoglycan-binding domain